ncbi:MAG: hypothetical protein K2F99_08540, partial [Muribaculaceae bacterium]|nr:hypothetical protein [Muribaculaceae bacterium]
MKIREFLREDLQISPGSIRIPVGDYIRKMRDRYEYFIKRFKRIHYTIYEVMPGARTLVHFKLPSETVENFYYDVLFEVTVGPSTVDLLVCDIKFFSNAPSFVYNFSYVFAHWNPDDNRPSDKRDSWMVDSMRGKVPKNSLFIDGLRQKIGPAPTHDKPVVRNPLGIP